jgi:osmotically-inducible protein OsmY
MMTMNDLANGKSMTIITALSPALKPADDSRSTDDLELRVRNFLESRNIPSLRRLGVSVLAGQVTLRGRVRTFYEKQLALHYCQSVAGVIKIMDAIEVGDVAID